MSSPSKHRNMTTHESAKGLTNPLESDLHDPNSTNTMNGILGTIDKNTFERWFMTNDEPWTKQIKSRTLDDKSKELSVLFQNGSSFNLRMKDSIEFDIVCIRRQMEATSAEKSDEKQGPLRRFASLPPEGEDLRTLNLPPLGEVPAKPG